jgi:hypothetical protein
MRQTADDMVSSRPMMILPISRAWMYSRAARCVYLVCSVLALALSGTLAGTRAAQAAFGSQTLPPATAVVLRLVLIPEVIWVGIVMGGDALFLVQLRPIVMAETCALVSFCFLLHSSRFGPLPLPCLSKVDTR